MSPTITTDQILTLFNREWIVEICGDFGLKSKERLVYPVDYHVMGDDVYIRDSSKNLISFKADKQFAKVRRAFETVMHWEEDKKLYSDPSNTGQKLFRESWRKVLLQRYLFYKAQGKVLEFDQPLPQPDIGKQEDQKIEEFDRSDTTSFDAEDSNKAEAGSQTSVPPAPTAPSTEDLGLEKVAEETEDSEDTSETKSQPETPKVPPAPVPPSSYQ